MKPEHLLILNRLLRQEKQRTLGKPVDPWPDVPSESHLAVLDQVAEALTAEIKDEAERDHRITCLLMEAEGLRGQIATLNERIAKQQRAINIHADAKEALAQARFELLQQIAALTAERDKLEPLTLDELRRIRALIGYGPDNGLLYDKIGKAIAARLAPQPPAPPQEDQR